MSFVRKFDTSRIVITVICMSSKNYVVWVGEDEFTAEPVAEFVSKQDAIACARRYATGVVYHLVNGESDHLGDVVFSTATANDAAGISDADVVTSVEDRNGSSETMEVTGDIGDGVIWVRVTFNGPIYNPAIGEECIGTEKRAEFVLSPDAATVLARALQQGVRAFDGRMANRSKSKT